MTNTVLLSCLHFTANNEVKPTLSQKSATVAENGGRSLAPSMSCRPPILSCLLNLQTITYLSSAIPCWSFTVSRAATRGPRVHLPVTYFQLHGITVHFVLVLFVSLHQKYWIPYLLTFCSLKYSLHINVIWRPTTFSQPILTPSAHSQCALILFWDFGLYKSLTYLLTYKLTSVLCKRVGRKQRFKATTLIETIAMDESRLSQQTV